MNSCAYYSYSDTKKNHNACSRESDERPIILNCAGCVSTNFRFITDNIREDYYLMFIVDGELTLETDRGLYTATAGEAVIFPPRYRYVYSFSGEDKICYLWAHFTGSYCERLLNELFGFMPLPSVLHVGLDNSLFNCFCEIFDVYIVGGALRDMALSVKLESLLVSISAILEKKQSARSALPASVTYIHSNYDTDITVSALASMENLSVSRYNAVFKREMGISPQKYLIDLRLRIACDLLNTTDMSVREIGISVGYEDQHFFSKLFKKHMGVSPTRYRVANMRKSVEPKPVSVPSEYFQ